MANNPHKPSAEQRKAAAEQASSGSFDSLKALIDYTRLAPTRAIVEWVANNAITPPGSIDPDSVPSAGALAMLIWVQHSAANYASFLATIWAKIIPAKSVLDMEAKFSDDGRRQLEMLVEFEKSLIPGDEDA